ncbi:(5-formylfuran-3-yl)methyl phosphate synthase [Aureimonas fodinaquatilis]|nr:(5-formylfuran-3-yl)methyl phosphate synthase [Aureimonas fodinaquatilis]
MLVSVRNVDEAVLALHNGADIIDLKEPGQGALGAVGAEMLAAVQAEIAGRRPVSAVAGDLPMDPAVITPAVQARAAADFVKIGFFPAEREAWEAVCADLAAKTPGIAKVAVFFGEDGVDPDFMPILHQAGFTGAMLDTRTKDGRRLLDHMSLAALRHFVDAASAAGLQTGLAGSLEAPDVARLLPLAPDYLGFRGALTAGERAGELAAEKVKAMSALFKPIMVNEASQTDRVFIRDFVQNMEIGAYGFERGRKQQVRFTIEADVLRVSRQPESMGDVYSYDVMMDAVAQIAERGHTDLVETLAEELAATILADSRVVEVTVRVEKLDLGPASAGIEIRRKCERL